jgi:hypothetical protein
LTERRTTLGLNWRPTGTPARRVDDFAEIPYAEPQPKRHGEPAAPGMGEIDQRLQNWARWNNAEYRIINRSPTAVHCDRLRREAGQEVSYSDERRSIDETDAYMIERGLFQLRGTQKAILRMAYAEGRRWQPILRVLGFSVKRELFDSLMQNAQLAISGAVELVAQQDKRKHG